MKIKNNRKTTSQAPVPRKYDRPSLPSLSSTEQLIAEHGTIRDYLNLLALKYFQTSNEVFLTELMCFGRAQRNDNVYYALSNLCDIIDHSDDRDPEHDLSNIFGTDNAKKIAEFCRYALSIPFIQQKCLLLIQPFIDRIPSLITYMVVKLRNKDLYKSVGNILANTKHDINYELLNLFFREDEWQVRRRIIKVLLCRRANNEILSAYKFVNDKYGNSHRHMKCKDVVADIINKMTIYLASNNITYCDNVSNIDNTSFSSVLQMSSDKRSTISKYISSNRITPDNLNHIIDYVIDNRDGKTLVDTLNYFLDDHCIKVLVNRMKDIALEKEAFYYMVGLRKYWDTAVRKDVSSMIEDRFK